MSTLSKTRKACFSSRAVSFSDSLCKWMLIIKSKFSLHLDHHLNKLLKVHRTRAISISVLITQKHSNLIQRTDESRWILRIDSHLNHVKSIQSNKSNRKIAGTEREKLNLKNRFSPRPCQPTPPRSSSPLKSYIQKWEQPAQRTVLYSQICRLPLAGQYCCGFSTFSHKYSLHVEIGNLGRNIILTDWSHHSPQLFGWHSPISILGWSKSMGTLKNRATQLCTVITMIYWKASICIGVPVWL